MPVNWPSSLPQEFIPDGYSRKLPDATLRTPMSAGPDKTRRLFTMARGRETVSMELTEAQRATLLDFWRRVTRSGEQTVIFPATLTGELVEVQFTGPPQITPDNAEYIGQISYKIQEPV